MAGLIRRHDTLIHSSLLQNECLAFIKNPQGKYEAARGTHDDLVVAYGISLQMYKESPQTSKKNEDREEDRKKRKKSVYYNRDPFSSVKI